MAAAPEAAESIYTVRDNGTKEWYNKHHQLHRTDGPAIETTDGAEFWYFEGKLHRVSGPAYEGVGHDTEWLLYGEMHRLDGPAQKSPSGQTSWYVNGYEVSESEFPAAVAAYCASHPKCPSVAYYMAGRFKKPARSA